MNWLDRLLEATEKAETPRSFIWWSGIAALSSIVKNNVSLNRDGVYDVFPNLYVLIVAESAMRKGFATSLAKKLVSKVGNNRVISGRSSIQSIIEQLGHFTTKEDGSVPYKDSTALIHSNELATLLVEDPQAHKILTQFYDSHYEEEWKNTLKSGESTLKNICVTLLGAMTPDDYKHFIPKSAIMGGFVGRCCIVFEEKLSRINPLTDEEASSIDYERLVAGLQDIALLRGKFKWSKEGKAAFATWYTPFMKSLQAHEMEDKTGFLGRLPDIVLKVAMLISISKKAKLILDLEDIQESMEKCFELTSGLNRIVSSSGMSDLAPKINRFIEILVRAYPDRISRADVLKKGYGDFHSGELDTIVLTMVEAQNIKAIQEGKITYYSLHPSVIEKYKKRKKDE